MGPDPSAGPSIDGPSAIARTSDIQNSIDDNRNGLEPSNHPGLKCPLHRELLRIRWRDLREWTVTLPAIVSRVGQPPGCVLESIQQLLGRDFLTGSESMPNQRSGENAKSDASSESKSHNSSSQRPRSVRR